MKSYLQNAVAAHPSARQLAWQQLGFYGLLCFLAHDYSNAALATVTIGALVTFFLHNVFGVKSKMFLGDGGSMLLGILISWLVISILGGHFHIREYLDGRVDFNLIAFTLAVAAQEA